jgi:PucR family transcriptional regulator, purine catabolism regulatory protein
MGVATEPLAASGLTVREALSASTLQDAKVLAGADGLGRVVQRLNVMEVPDILPWVKPHELLLTTAYPLREVPSGLVELVPELDARGLAGLAIKLGRYLDALPDGMLQRADELDFPIVQLPDNVGFDDILNQVLTGVLNRQAARLVRSEEIHRAFLQIVLSGGGLLEIAADLATMLGGPAAIIDPEGRVLAGSGLDELGPPPAGARLFDDVLQLGDSGPCIVAGDGIRCLTAPISAGARQHGRVVVVESVRRLSPNDLLALENAATVAALAISKALAVAAVESKFQSDFLHDLLNGRVARREDAVARAASLGWDFARRLVVVVADPDPATIGQCLEGQGLAGHRFTSELTAAVRAKDPTAAVVGFLSEAVVIAGGPDPGATPEEARGLVESFIAGVRVNGGVSYGVSRAVDDVMQIADAYEQARSAVRIGRQIDGMAGVVHFDDLGAFRLISLVPDTAELRRFAREVLGSLADSTPDAEDLRQTLRVLLECNLNIAEATRRLHFHYNTLRYRLEKLERMLGPFTTDPQVRLNLLLALQVLQLRQLRP